MDGTFCDNSIKRQKLVISQKNMAGNTSKFYRSNKLSKLGVDCFLKGFQVNFFICLSELNVELTDW